MINSIFIFWYYRISMFFLLLFLGLFLRHKYNKIRTSLIMSGTFLISAVLDYLNFFVYTDNVTEQIVTLLEIILVQCTALLISRYRDFRAIFVGTTSAAYVLIGNILCSLVYTKTSNIAYGLTVQSLIHIVVIGYFIYNIRDKFLESLEIKNMRWHWLCLIPVLFYITVYTLAMRPVSIYEKPENAIAVICVLLLMLVSYILLIRLLTQMNYENELESNNTYLETYSERLKHEADLLQKNEENTAIMRHDLRHLIAMVETNINNNETDKALELLGNFNQNVKELRQERYCENLSVNAIVAHYSEAAEKNGVIIDTDIHIPQIIEIDEYEFATVVSNLLENAVNAASEVLGNTQKTVFIKAYIVKKQIIVEINNTFINSVEIDERTGMPISNKGNGHGYGFKSVCAFVRKYNANFDYYMEDNKFFVRLLVNFSI